MQEKEEDGGKKKNPREMRLPSHKKTETIAERGTLRRKRQETTNKPAKREDGRGTPRMLRPAGNVAEKYREKQGISNGDSAGE